jgi:hypothetical protein
MIRTVNVSRYVTPLREGGSLPAIIEADDNRLYVMKFRGAGQGVKSLIAELIGGELARRLQLKVPVIVFAELDGSFGRIEGDEEIQDLLKASTGLNLALTYLPESITFDPIVNRIDPLLASKIVWLDSLLMNVDRTPRNTNMLIWKGDLWLIDHGASLYFHHNWESFQGGAKPFPQIRKHVLISKATRLTEADKEFKTILSRKLFEDIADLIPDNWLNADRAFDSAEANRKAYVDFLESRLNYSDQFIKEAFA